MRIITLNVNGLRSAVKKGLFHWLSRAGADIICLQEIRITETQPDFVLPGYLSYFFYAEKKGYSGVAIYTHTAPDRVRQGLGWNLVDREGRYLQLDFGSLSIASIYLPSGSSGVDRQQLKFSFLKHYFPILQQQIKADREYILCGDWNIAHQAIDLKNWRNNQKNSGFLPEERAWLTQVFDLGYVDAFRALNSESDQYTWWSNRGQAWMKNVGWRIDYQIITPKLKPYLRAAHIYKAERFADHAPLTIEYDLPLG